MRTYCLCCDKSQKPEMPRICPECGHVFQGNGWDGIDGYRAEAADIIFGLKVRENSVKPERLVMEVLNQAFDLSLTPQSCIVPAQEIAAILGKE